jgi:ABC-2 type transport system permease protein
MRTILALARKDLRVLTRVRSGMFFTFVWPMVVAILFGMVFAGPGQNPPATLRVVVVDEDDTVQSRTFLDALEASGEFAVDRAPRVEAEAMVRRGQRAAYVVVAAGFGDAARQMWTGPPRHFEIGSDPARQAEAWMIEGLLTKQVMADIGPRLPWTPVRVSRATVLRERVGPANGFDITFPQGIMWGIIGCVMSFAIGLVSERVHGTFVRLQTAPIDRAQILAGKALACFVTIALLQVLLLIIGVFGFGVRPTSYPLLTLACVSAAVGFIGFMMMIAGISRTEQAASGAGWALLMPMTLFGGGMMPQFVMPAWMQGVGSLSPVKWAILGIEGALWRNFTLNEMLTPCAILLGFGVVCFALGARGLRDT